MNDKSWLPILQSYSCNLKSKIQNRKWAGIVVFAVTFLMCGGVAQAQQPKVYRVGVLLPGSAWNEIIDGLRLGLRELGLEEKKHFILEIRDTKGDLKVAEEA